MNPFRCTQEPGVYHDMSAEDYHSTPTLSKSTMDHLHRSPAHMLAYLQQPHEDTPATVMGSLVHCLTLEPELYGRRYAIVDGNRQTKAVKEQVQEAENAGLVVVKSETLAESRAMSQAVRSHPSAGRILECATATEISAFWEESVDGTTIPCKARLDVLAELPGFGLVVADLKKTRDASERGMSRHIAEYRYHVQAAWYRRALYMAGRITTQQFLLICVEDAQPYTVGLYNIAEQAQQVALREIEADMLTLAECIKTDKWPGYPECVVELDLPRWAYKQEVE